MSKKFFALVSFLILLSLVLAACGGTTPEPTEKQPVATEEQPKAQIPEECADNPDESVCAVIEPGSTIKIGYAGPMTGDYSAFGIDISNAGLLAAKDAEPIDGFSFELLVEDTQGSGEGGASVANLYVADPDVVAIAGHTFSGSTAAAIPIYNQARRPMLSPSATRADLTQGDQDVFNRIPFTDDIQGTSAAKYLYNNLGIRKLAVMHDGDAYGKGLAEKVKDVFTELGGEVVAFEAITPGETDYSAALTDIGSKGPEAIYYGGYYPEAAVIAGNMAVAGMGDVILFSDDGTFGASFIELAGPQAEGVFAASALPPSSPEKEAFDAEFEAAYGEVPGSLSTFTWHGYDVVSALIYAIKQVAVLGDDGNLYIPRDALVQAVDNLTDYKGLTGTITCTSGECNTAGPTFFVVKNGEWVQAEGGAAEVEQPANEVKVVSGVPEECADNPDESVCAVIEPGSMIKLGYAGPMTGDYSAFGIDISNAGLLAAKDAEPIDGFSFELLVEDTQGSGEGGASVANLYVADPDVVAIAGHTFSGSTAAAIPIYNQARRPMLSPSATRADLTQGDQDVFNRIPFTDDIQGTSAAKYLYNNLGIRKLAVMHDGDAYGKGLAEKVKDVFTELGGEVVAFEAITPGETDYSAALTDIGSKGPEAIYYGGYYPEAAVIAGNMAVAGMGDVILFSDDGTFGASFIELAGPQAEGVFAASALPPSSPEKEAFDAEFEAAYGEVPGSLSTFTWHGYDVVSALIYAIKQVAMLSDDGNLYIPRDALVQAVDNLKDYKGLTGTITCMSGECNTAGPTFFVVQDGEWVQAP